MAQRKCPEKSSDSCVPGVGAQDASGVEQLVTFLLSGPSCADIARYLVMNHHDHLGLEWVNVFRLGEDAYLRDIGHFGASSELTAALQVLSLWKNSAPAEAARFNRVVIANSLTMKQSSNSGCLEVAGFDVPIIAVPLASTQRVFGSITFSFAMGTVIHSRFVRELRMISDLICLYLGDCASDARAPRMSASSTGGDTDETSSTVVHKRRVQPKVLSQTFTKRNVAILRLLAEGLTYEQIASRIGFSHSTVRTDLMKIYQMLGVSTRDAAIARAVDQGIIRSLAPDIRVRLRLLESTLGPQGKAGQLQLL